jgi:hypothetical protein
MTHTEEPVEDAFAEALREAAGDPRTPAPPRRENPIVGWAKAIFGGIRDTAQDVVDEGRRGARSKQSQMWDKYDSKTRRRRG